MKKENKDQKTLGILAHLQKNIPPSKQPTVEEDLEKEMELSPEDEEEPDQLDVLRNKKPKKIMFPTSY